MPNNELLTPTMIAREALLRLKANLAIANEVYRDYSDDYAQIGDTVTVRKPATFEAKDFSDSIDPQDIEEGKVPVKMDIHKDVSVRVTSKELTLDIENFGTQVLDGAVQAIAESVNQEVADAASKYVPFHVGEPGDTPDTLKKGFTNPMKKLNINKVPNTNRRLFFDPVAQAELLNLDALVGLDKSGSTEALREASMGRVMGFDTFMDQDIRTHEAGTYVENTGDPTEIIAVSHDSDDYTISTVTFDSDEAADDDMNLRAGDLFTVTDGDTGKEYQYVVIEDTAADASNEGELAGVKISPRYHKDDPEESTYQGDGSNDEVEFTDDEAKGHVSNIAFHPNFMALVSRPLEQPMGKSQEQAYTATDPDTGLSIRVVMDYSIDNKHDVISLDCLFGKKVIFPQLACQVLG